MSTQDEAEPVLTPTAIRQPRQRPQPIRGERIALVDLLDRVLAGGVVVSGEVTLTIADVDMVRISLRALVTSVSAMARAGDDGQVPGR